MAPARGGAGMKLRPPLLLRYMAPARAALAAALDQTDVSAPLYDVFSTLDARRPHARDAPEALRARVCRAAHAPALWEAAYRALARAGIRERLSGMNRARARSSPR